MLAGVGGVPPEPGEIPDGIFHVLIPDPLETVEELGSDAEFECPRLCKSCSITPIIGQMLLWDI